MRVGILGMGSIGRRHAANVLSLGHEVIAYDSNIQVQEAIKGDYPTCGTLRDLWSHKPSAVLICTPPGSHLELAYEAFKHGCHTFIEKPLGISLDGWQDLAEGLEAAHLINMVACNWRWHDNAWAIFGEPNPPVIRMDARYYLPDIHPDYRTSYFPDTGAILDVGWHLIDLAIARFGPAMLAGAAWFPATHIGLPDTCDGTAEILLRHHWGTISSIHVSIQEPSLAPSEPEANLAMYQREMAYFVDRINSGEPTCNSIAQAIWTLELCLEAKEKGRVIDNNSL